MANDTSVRSTDYLPILRPEVLKIMYKCDRCSSEVANFLTVNIPIMCFSGTIPFILCKVCRIKLMGILGEDLEAVEEVGLAINLSKVIIQGPKGSDNEIENMNILNKQYTKLIYLIHSKIFKWLDNGTTEKKEETKQ